MQNSNDASAQQLRGEHQKKVKEHRGHRWPVQMFAVPTITAGQQRGK